LPGLQDPANGPILSEMNPPTQSPHPMSLTSILILYVKSLGKYMELRRMKSVSNVRYCARRSFVTTTGRLVLLEERNKGCYDGLGM